MPSCCVPNCKSRSYTGLSKGVVTYHEIPANLEMRELWLANVNRQNWTPNDRTKVCSLHFQQSDFRPGVKIKILKKGSVPSIFPISSKYLVSLLPAAEKPNSSIKQEENQEELNNTENDPDMLVEADEVNLNTMDNDKGDTIESSKEGEDCAKVTEKVICAPVSTEPTVYIQVSQEKRAALNEATNQQTLSHPSSIGAHTVSVQTDRLMFKKNAASESAAEKYRKKLKACQMCLNRRKKVVARMSDKIDSLTKQLQTYDTGLDGKLLKIRADAVAGDRKATFLLDQISQYCTKRPRWSELTLRMCLAWRMKSTMSYAFGNDKVIPLPSRASLERYKSTHLATLGMASSSSVNKDTAPVLPEESETSEPVEMCEENVVVDGIVENPS